MKKYFFLFLIMSIFNNSVFAKIDEIIQAKFANTNFSNIQTIDQLSDSIKNISTDPKTELELLLQWTDKYMSPDSLRFFKGGATLSINESINKKIGLCDEYCNIVRSFCDKNGIKNIRIEGYVKEDTQNPSQKFEETNHAWNAVYIDSTWMLCDLFWSTCEVKKIDGKLMFNKRIDTIYYIHPPSVFISTHLPADPLFQFSMAPISIDEFTSGNTPSSIANKFNYKDSLSKYLVMTSLEQVLQTAKNSYQFNKNNPNMLIAAYYNYAVDVYNNSKSKDVQLTKAIDYLNTASNLIKISEIESIQDLANPILQARENLKLRLDFNKKHRISK